MQTWQDRFKSELAISELATLICIMDKSKLNSFDSVVEYLKTEFSGFDYDGILPKCKCCTLMPEKLKVECGYYYRPGTTTKAGFPDKNGSDCRCDFFNAEEREEIRKAYTEQMENE